jgi:hypothetical protein
MGIAPEDKYVMERYCETAERFMKILEFYQDAKPEDRAYMDRCFKGRFGRTFGAYFRPLLEERAGRKRPRAKK